MWATTNMDVSQKRSPRSDMRDSSARTQSRRKDRSASASSRSGRSRSRSRSLERSSRSRRSRSPTSHWKQHSSRSHRSSRRSHRSRSRSASRDRRRDDHRSRRSHRVRSVSRSRSRGRHHGHGESSSRKRRQRERSRSTERRRGSGDGEELSHRDRRRRRRDSSPKDAKTESNAAQAAAVEGSGSRVDGKRDVAASEGVQTVVEKTEESTPTSQESVATSTGAMTVTSSQSDVEVAKSQEAAALASNKTEEKKQEKGSKSAQGAVKVDVRSIKMDILKALADARSTIAGIKGVAETAPGTESGQENTNSRRTEPPAQATGGGDETSDARDVSVDPKPSTLEPVLQPSVSAPLVVKPKSVSPPKTEIAAADVDEFDIFSAADRLGSGLPLSPVAVGAAPAVVDAPIQSNYDDAEGYYKPSIGEVLNGKYRVMGTVGKGVFSTVLRCQCLGSSGESVQDELDVVAIKLIRNNEVMREASQTEIKILTELSARDPRDKKHCVRLLERFEHRNHVALVFEPMQMNVREAMKKFGGKGGISIQAVRIFCKHLLIALTHLESCNVVHADIKPDNVLLDEKQTMIKLCDFGSAFKMHEGNHDPTPYLVSRFYRAPEIVLGLPYDKAVDMWSVGCCLYEMFTGKVMFPGATNNEMLKLFMELKGKVPNKIVKKHRQAYIEQFQMEPHFTEDNKFVSQEVDRVTNKPIRRHLDAIKTRFDLGSALLSAKSSTDDRKQVLELRNLLERMFTLDSTKRITPKEALAHPFVKTEATKA